MITQAKKSLKKLHYLSAVSILLLSVCLVICGCRHLPAGHSPKRPASDWKTKVKKAVFYVDEYPDWDAPEMVARKFFTIDNPKQVAFLANGVDMVTEADRIGPSWLGGF